MFPPMVSASPPPSDDELTGDEADEFGAADSSFDITGLSQKLPACHVKGDASAAAGSEACPLPDPPAAKDPAALSVHRLSAADEWSEFSTCSDIGSMAPGSSVELALPANRLAAEQATDLGHQSAGVDAGSQGGPVDTAPPANPDRPAAEPARACGRLSDSDSDTDSDQLQPWPDVQRSDSDRPALAGQAAQPCGTASAERAASPTVCDGGHRTGDQLTERTATDQTSTDGPPEVTGSTDTGSDEFGQTCAGGERTESDEFGRQRDEFGDPCAGEERTESDEFGRQHDEFGDPCAGGERTESDEFGAWSGAVRHSEGLSGSPPPSRRDGDDLPETERRPHAPIEPPADDFGDFAASTDSPEDRVAGGGSHVTSEGDEERVPSPGDIGTFTTPSDEPANRAPSSHDPADLTTFTGDDQITTPRDLPNVASSTGDPASRATSPDDFGNFATSSGDHGDGAASADEFGDFAAPTDDFGDFSGPADGPGDGWPPDGGGPAGFADFGAVFAAPADTGSAAPSLEPAAQLADPADLSDDEFGDFEDFQTPTLQEPPTSTDEEALSALLCRLFPLVPEEREPSCVPLDVSSAWYQLREPDSTAALQYRWAGSRANTELLHALRVDASNVISFAGWCGRTGRFATGLDSEPIQPVRGSPPEPPSQQRQTPAATSEVPPAAFDWSSSGLKNPLESTGPEAYSLLDLDVFDTNSRPVAASNSFLSCLERELLAAEVAAPPAAGSVYSQLLAQTAGPPLSEAAARVLARIPDIDFMQAKVLMFPVRGE